MSGLIIDNFAGCGGASLGIEEAMGRPIDVAINHNPVAIGVHQVNHPKTLHLVEDVWSVARNPNYVTEGKPVDVAWFSPDCRHHSKAKGGRPVSKSVRGLAWVVVRWAVAVKPRLIVLENVEEFQDWGPLGVDDKPCPERRGQTFNLFVHRLRQVGYQVDWRELRACDYGAPTIRKRLFLVARLDMRPVWPKPTHGKPGQLEVAAGVRKPWRTAAEIIDWSLPCPSIFLTREESRPLGIKRPLADATMRRIARGVVRYVLNNPKPFIVRFTQNGVGQTTDEPLDTVMAGAPKFGVVEPEIIGPFVAGVGGRMGQSSPRDVDGPYQTATAKADAVLVTPFLARTAHGDVGRDGKRRGQSVHPLSDPIGTVMGSRDHAIIAPTLIQTGYGERPGQTPRVPGLDKPLGTAMAGGAKHAVVAAFLAQHNTDMVGHHPEKPLSTIVGKGCQQGVVAAHLLSMKGNERRDSSIEEPAASVCAQGTHATLIATFLQKYYGSGAGTPGLPEPMHTATTKDRFALVKVEIDGATYVIADIGMRMLTPRELARAQDFPDTYVLDRLPDGRPVTKTDQVRLIGNSVCRSLSRAIVSANRDDIDEIDMGGAVA